MDVEGFLGSITASSGYAGQIAHVHRIPGRQPRWADMPEGLAPEIIGFFDALGISRLYRHQAEAIEALLGGRDVLLTTGTASGKSLCFQIPILQALLADPQATALLVFPLKALARDQAETWNRGTGTLPGSANPETLVARSTQRQCRGPRAAHCPCYAEHWDDLARRVRRMKRKR